MGWPWCVPQEVLEELGEHLDTVEDSAGSLLHIVNAVLDLAKIEAGKLELEVVPFRIRETVGSAMRALKVRETAEGGEHSCFLWRRGASEGQGPMKAGGLGPGPPRLRRTRSPVLDSECLETAVQAVLRLFLTGLWPCRCALPRSSSR